MQTEIFQSHSLKVPVIPCGTEEQDMMGEELGQYDITCERGGWRGEVKVTIYHWPPKILRIITS